MNTSLEMKRHWMVSPSHLDGQLKPLLQDVSTEVCIIGAGITGLSAAYELLRSGVSNVIVVDAHSFAECETTRSTGHLSVVLEERNTRLAQIHGTRIAQNVVRSHFEAITAIETLAKTHSIECGFKRVDAYWFESKHVTSQDLRDEVNFLHATGIDHAYLTYNGPTRGIRGFEGLSCIHLENQAQMNPVHYLLGLAQVVLDLGGKIYVRTPVIDVAGGSPAQLVTRNQNKITADSVIIAGNVPIGERRALVHRLVNYRTYAISGFVPKGSVDESLQWDSENPYHYVRLDTESDSNGSTAHDTLIVGGEDHRTGQQDRFEDYFLALERWTRFHYPKFKWVTSRWSGQVTCSHDGLALIGQHSSYGENVFIAGAYGRNGLTYGSIAGTILSHYVLGQHHPWMDLYDPERIRVVSAPSRMRSNLNAILQYRQWITSGEVATVNEIRPNEGRVLRDGVTKIAVYRDEQGSLHCLNASCPHLGGVVRWNDAEKTWDCPCHGSRFDRYGTVIAGPANQDLERIEQVPAQSEGVVAEKLKPSHESAESKPKMP